MSRKRNRRVRTKPRRTVRSLTLQLNRVTREFEGRIKELRAQRAESRLSSELISIVRERQQARREELESEIAPLAALIDALDELDSVHDLED